MIAVKVEPQSLARIRATLVPKAVELKVTNKYEAFRLQVNSGVIVAYTSGKIVANNDESYDILREALRSTEAHTNEIVMGSDEAGKGEWLGPLVVAVVAVSPATRAEMRALGVMDSKELTTKRIEQIAPQIKKLALAFKVIVIQPEQFNERFSQLKKKGENLNNMLAEAHAEAIESVYDEIKPHDTMRVVIDEFDRIKTAKRLRALSQKDNVTIVQKPRAEEEIPVACASILARAEREFWITEKSRELRINLRTIKEEDAMIMGKNKELFKVSYLKNRGG